MYIQNRNAYVSTVPTCIMYVYIPLMSTTFLFSSHAVATCSRRETLELKSVPVASDASDASFVVSLDANRNFSDYGRIIIRIMCTDNTQICALLSVMMNE